MKHYLNLYSLQTHVISREDVLKIIEHEKKTNPLSRDISILGIETRHITYCLYSGAKLGKNNSGEYFLYGYSRDSSDVQEYLNILN